MSERFFRSNRPGYPHPVSSELENSGIRVTVGDCSVTERRRWRPPYQTGKKCACARKHYKHNEDRRTAPGVCGNCSVPLSHSENVVTRNSKKRLKGLLHCFSTGIDITGNEWYCFILKNVGNCKKKFQRVKKL